MGLRALSSALQHPASTAKSKNFKGFRSRSEIRKSKLKLQGSSSGPEAVLKRFRSGSNDKILNLNAL